jgi:hypothetical protein
VKKVLIAVIPIFAILALSFFLVGSNYPYAVLNQEISWDHTFSVSGTNGTVMGATATSDGGFAIVGWSLLGSHLPWHVALVKMDANGNEQWTKVFPDTNSSQGYSVDQTTDGGFIISGSTVDPLNSKVGSLLLKVDQHGNEEWNRSFAGGGFPYWTSAHQALDGGYILGVSPGINIVKTYSNGSEQWQRTYSSGVYAGSFFVLQKTSDGGYIVLAFLQYSFTIGTLLLKIDGVGNQQWNRTFVSSELVSIQQTSDGGYILTGTSNSSALIVKLYANGTTEWSSTYSGSVWSDGEIARQTSDGGYVTMIDSPSFLGDRSWLWKTEANGTTSWSKLLTIYCIPFLQQTPDGDYVVVGRSASIFSGDIMKVLGSPPISVQATVSALNVASLVFLAATIATILVMVVESRREN